MSDDTTVLRLRAGAAEWLAEDGEAVLLDLNRSWYMGLNRSATILWAELAKGATRAHLIATLHAEYDVPDERAERDVDAFVGECVRRELLG